MKIILTFLNLNMAMEISFKLELVTSLPRHRRLIEQVFALSQIILKKLAQQKIHRLMLNGILVRILHKNWN